MSRVVMICLFLASAHAFAQAPVSPPPESPPAPEADKAKHHFEQGAALFNDGNYPAALAEFEQSYRLRPAPFVRYNIGITQKALFRYAEAIASLEAYLGESPDLSTERRSELEGLVKDMKGLLADVTVTVVPDNATITVDGRQLGTSPLAKPLPIAAGLHKLEISADGYEPQKKEIMVTAGVPLAQKFELVLIPKTGKIRINSPVPRAMVTVDGKPAGYAPVEVELETGGHMVEVSAQNYQTRREELVVAAGQTREVAMSLDKVVRAKKSWYQQWYVWTGVGAALLGGTGACYLAGCFDRTQSPIEGTLAPGAGGVQ